MSNIFPQTTPLFYSLSGVKESVIERQRNKIAFIVNPIAGGHNKDEEIARIRRFISKRFEYEFLFTGTPEVEANLIDVLQKAGYDMVVGIGGDGTINRIGNALLHTDIAMAIIPAGSGNGFARHFGIPLEPEKAIEVINSGHIVCIDAGQINDKPFFCTAGVGFDAHISRMFSSSKRRGFSSYAQLTFRQLGRYTCEHYHILADGEELEREAFSITFANAGQFGNNAWIAPQADIQDGWLNMCLLKPFHQQDLPFLGLRLFNRSITGSRFYESRRIKEVLLTRQSVGHAHFDGEPLLLPQEVHVKVLPHALKVVVPEAFKVQSWLTHSEP